MTDPSIVIPPIIADVWSGQPAGQDRSKPPPIIEGSIQHKVGSDFFKQMIERQLGAELYRQSHIDEPTPTPLAPLPPPLSPQTSGPAAKPARLAAPQRPTAPPPRRPATVAPIKPPANPPLRRR